MTTKIFYFLISILEAAYLPCLAHNLQLVIKDGLKLSDDYSKLIQHVSTNIVSKSKCSSIIAAELRKLYLKLNKKNLTRWNSILFMVRSVLKLSADDMKAIRNQMPGRTPTEREIRAKFDLTDVQHDMLLELKDVLEMFEFVTDEFQSNKISISRVYPSVMYLRSNLLEKDETGKLVVYEYTNDLRMNLVKNLNNRFEDIIKQDVILISTFLDPNFGLSYFEMETQSLVIAKMKALLKKSEAKETVLMNQNQTILKQTEKKILEKRKNNYIKFNYIQPAQSDKIEDLLNDYICTVGNIDFKQCPLMFWKANETKFRPLAEIAKKYLGVPASSAAVERMFSISGHILSSKRTKMSISLFSLLVFLKLNENFIN